MLLARALAWRRVNAAVRGGEALRFVVVAGAPRGAEAALFSRLTQWRAPAAAAAAGGGGAASGGGGGGEGGAGVVELRPLADAALRNAHVARFPALPADGSERGGEEGDEGAEGGDKGSDAALARGLATMLTGARRGSVCVLPVMVLCCFAAKLGVSIPVFIHLPPNDQFKTQNNK